MGPRGSREEDGTYTIFLAMIWAAKQQTRLKDRIRQGYHKKKCSEMIDKNINSGCKNIPKYPYTENHRKITPVSLLKIRES